MIDQINEKLELAPRDSNIYLIEALNHYSGFFSSNGNLIYMVTNKNNSIAENLETEFLSLNTAVTINAIENDSSFKDGLYDMIIFKGDIHNTNFESFIKLCINYSNNLSEIGFKEFFYSLIELFQLQTEQSFKNAVGLYGELKFMQYIWNEFKIDISQYWHKAGTMSKYDFSNNSYVLEVKTTSKTSSVLTIKHNQIFDLENCLLATVFCDKEDNGETIDELLSKLKNIPHAFKNLNFSLNVAKELKRVSVDDFAKTCFLMDAISVYKCNVINPFHEIPMNISNLVYDLDVEDEETIDSQELAEILSFMTM